MPLALDNAIMTKVQLHERHVDYGRKNVSVPMYARHLEVERLTKLALQAVKDSRIICRIGCRKLSRSDILPGCNLAHHSGGGQGSSGCLLP